MNREIKFRGKLIEDNDWYFGDLRQKNGKSYIFPQGELTFIHSAYEVDPDTVGQYTGLKDKNGVEIYEGDIIMSSATTGEPIYHEVFYNEEEASFYASLNGNRNAPFGVCGIRRLWIQKFNKEVVGNIHDNPELFKKGEQ